jgi:hypothetical protein
MAQPVAKAHSTGEAQDAGGMDAPLWTGTHQCQRGE